MVTIKTFVCNAFQENTFLLYDETKECVIIDAGNSNAKENSLIDGFIETNELKLISIINTHCHIDHLMGNSYFVDKYNVDSIAHKNEMPLIDRSKDMAIAFGFDLEEPPVPNIFVEDGEIIRFGNSELEVRLVPGHSPGSIVLYCKKDNFVIVGDVLFSGSIGRTDLPGGDHQTLIDSIEDKLFSLDPSVVAYPGHGESTTIGKEKETNPFF